MKHQVFAHNIGFDTRRLTHSEWVDWLFGCARAWNLLPNGQDQALNVQRQAIAASKIDAKQCTVCLRPATPTQEKPNEQ